MERFITNINYCFTYVKKPKNLLENVNYIVKHFYSLVDSSNYRP